VSDSERPDLLDPSRRVTVEDIRALVGAVTPHFALQVRDRIRRLIEPLDPDDAARIEGERQVRRLEELARTGVTSGTKQESEQPLPSLTLGDEGSEH
jgi:hypothetical protein